MHPIGRLALGAAAVGAACFAYGALYEVNAYRLRRFNVPVLAAGTRPLRVLHVSDLHLVPSQRRKIEWTRGLAALEPDFVINTGDNIAHVDAVDSAIEALEPLLELPGAFVFGSNDYWAPKPRNPLKYLYRRGVPAVVSAPPLPIDDLHKRIRAQGWVDLTNARGALLADGRRISLVGVDDPHLQYDRYDDVAGQAPDDADLAIGVAHAPYRRVLDAMSADGYQLLMAGHTHGGQVCLPGVGALVSNCDLDTRRVKGLSRYGASWLHVSAGLGASPYAPYRFACYPEASLLTLLPVDWPTL